MLALDVRVQSAFHDGVFWLRFGQERSALDPALSVAENVAGRGDVVHVGGQAVRIESFLDKFGFDARMRNSPLSTL